MQNADVILSMLNQKSIKSSAYVFDRLYRNLFNLDMYMLAYNNIYVTKGNKVQGTDEGPMDSFPLRVVQETIALLRQESYNPQSVRENSMQTWHGTYKVPGPCSFQDQLVQEVIRMLLQAIYEPIFTGTSHGFRPGRSCHSALVQVKTTGRGANWAIEGEIKDFSVQMQYGKLRALLATRISDGRFLNLIDKFLKAGYIEWNPLVTSRTGTPQGGDVISLLANIYLHELDAYMEKICAQYHHNDIRVNYTRYATNFIVMIMGNRHLAEQIRQGIKDFLEQELQLELALEKMVITHLLRQRARFLGYEITKSAAARQASGHSLEFNEGVTHEAIQLLVPADVIREKLKPFVENGKAIHYKARIHLPLLDLIQQYNTEISSLYQYYCLATDVSTKVGKFKHYHYTSLVKTVARKEKSSVAKVINKYGVDVKHKQDTGTRKIIGISYATPEGPKTLIYFNDPLKKQDQPQYGSGVSHMFDVVAGIQSRL